MGFAQAPAPAAEAQAPAFKQEELEQLVAPIALYPDSLVSQILMASTYPIEIIYAERWLKANKNLQGDALTAALEKEPWDPSVKSLINFPEVVSMMSEKLDWTQKLGDAFLAQQKEVMGVIQKLRGKAKTEGNLESNEQQTVVVREEAQNQVIVIESASPDVVYVPTYNPTVVYGSWPYPAYPPYYYYPPGYVAGTAALSFGLGVACGAAWGYAWGGCGWGHGEVDIDVDRNSFRNTNIDRNRYKNEIGSRNRNAQGGRGSWQHDPSHRKGAAYRDQNTARKFGGASTADAARSRDSFRGRAESGRQDLARGGGDQSRGGRSSNVSVSQPGDRGGSGNRPQTTNRSTTPQGRSGSANRPTQSQGSRGGAFDGAGQGSSARRESSRGQASRSSSSGGGSRGSASRGGGSRGGGSRGGGARGGGRGGGGRGPGYDLTIY
jgi:hypothetical protein